MPDGASVSRGVSRHDHVARAARRRPDRRAPRRGSRRALSGSMPSASVAWACGSRSTTSTRAPSAARQPARFTAVVVFPQPPFWFTIAMVRMTIPRSAAVSARSLLPRDAGRARRRAAPGGPASVRRRPFRSARAPTRRRGARGAPRAGAPPGLDLALELRDLEDPLLSGDGVEGGPSWNASTTSPVATRTSSASGRRTVGRILFSAADAVRIRWTETPASISRFAAFRATRSSNV